MQLEYLERDELVERWKEMAFPFGMIELYCEFAKAEVAKLDDFDKQQYLYHEDEDSLPNSMELVPPHNPWPLKRIHICGGGFRNLSQKELQYMVYVEVLKLEYVQNTCRILQLEYVQKFYCGSQFSRCIRNCRNLCFKGVKTISYWLY